MYEITFLMRYFSGCNDLIRLLFLLIMPVLTGCQIDSAPQSELDKIQQRGVLRVGTLNNQLSYYIGPDGPAGLDYELAREFANQLGVRLEMKPAYRQSNLFPALEKGEVDIVAAGLSHSNRRLTSFRAAPIYYYVSQQVAYKNGQWRPRNLEQLINKQQEWDEEQRKTGVVVINDSHFKQTLKAIQAKHPDFYYNVDEHADVNDLFNKVLNDEIAFTIADSVDLSLAQRLYPDLTVAFELTEDQPISWFMRKSDDESLYALLIEFFGDIKQSGELAHLEEKYIGHIGSFDYVDTRAFIRALDDRLPLWAELFQEHSNEFDWRLIAALAYQESHWNPEATSPTGVRGMMMLTQATAASVGVSDRLDPKQSVQGGVEYLRRIVERIPDSISEHEKIWFALASYNIGYGHMMDARRLTKRQNGDPNAWSDVKDRLPLLKQKEYYATTRYGYARGDETRNYVENIRRYYQSIIGHVSQQTRDDNNDVFDLTVIPVTETPEETNNFDDTVTNESAISKEIANELTAETEEAEEKEETEETPVSAAIQNSDSNAQDNSIERE